MNGPRPQRWGAIVVVGLLLVGVVLALVGPLDPLAQWRSWTTELRREAEAVPQLALEQRREQAGSGSMLLVARDATGRGAGFALLAAADDATPTLVTIPADLFDIVPGFGDFALADAVAFEGPELAASTVTNILGVRIDTVLTLGPGDLAGLLREPLPVALTRPLIVPDGSGGERLVAAEGMAGRPPDVVETLLVVRGADDPLAWLERQTATWEALIVAAGADLEVGPALAAFADDPDLALDLLVRSAIDAEPGLDVTVLPVERVAVAGAATAFKVDAAAVTTLVERRLGYLQLAPEPRPRVEILNGNGRIGATRPVAEVLITHGFRVTKTDNADRFDYEETLVIAQGREHRRAAEAALDLIGTGSLLLELRAPSGVVHVSIIVGADLPSGEE